MPGRKRGTGNQHSQPARNSLSSELRKLTQLGPQPPGIEHPTPRPPVTHFTTREICSKEKPEQKVLQFAGCVRDVSCCCDQIPVRKQRKREGYVGACGLRVQSLLEWNSLRLQQQQCAGACLNLRGPGSRESLGPELAAL